MLELKTVSISLSESLRELSRVSRRYPYTSEWLGGSERAGFPNFYGRLYLYWVSDLIYISLISHYELRNPRHYFDNLADVDRGDSEVCGNGYEGFRYAANS